MLKEEGSKEEDRQGVDVKKNLRLNVLSVFLLHVERDYPVDSKRRLSVVLSLDEWDYPGNSHVLF